MNYPPPPLLFLSTCRRMWCALRGAGKVMCMKKHLLALAGALIISLPLLAADTVINLNGESQTGSFNGKGPITGSYTIHGPGTFTSTGRIYPNDTSHIVTIDEGAIVWLTTHNKANDGLIVSGNDKCEVRLGNCTVGSCKSGSEICLARCVTLVLADEEAGTTITTANESGEKIVMQTNPAQQAKMNGAGRLNLVGGGTFRFDSNTTFSNTGLITVDDGTTAIINTSSPPPAPILVKSGSVLSLADKSYIPNGHVTIEQGGVIDIGGGSGELLFQKGITLSDGAVLRMTVGTTVPYIKPKSTYYGWQTGTGIYYPKGNGGKVTISPQEGTGLIPGRYILIESITSCGIDMFALDRTTLGDYRISLDLDDEALVLVVSEKEELLSAVWTGGASGVWSGANWNDGKTFPEGKEARFATEGAMISVDVEPSVSRLAFDASATLTGEKAIKMPIKKIYVANGCTATIDAPITSESEYLNKYGSGTLVVNAAKGDTHRGVALEGQIEFRLKEGEYARFKTEVDHDRIGGVSYIGPGIFESERLYPRNYGSTNIVDGGATVILSGKSATDGIIVSGGLNGEGVMRSGAVALGDCTIKSSYSKDTLLQRFVNIVFTDPVKGTTISTDGADGNPIEISTDEEGVFYGAGKLNIVGSGSFSFGKKATFLQTGETIVKSGATALLRNDISRGSFKIEDGATIAGVGDMPRRIAALTMESGASFGTGDNRTIIAPAAFACAPGAILEFVVGTADKGGVPLLDLRGANVSIGEGAKVRVVLSGEMPSGSYDFVRYDESAAEQMANLSFEFVNDASSECTGTLETAGGAIRLTIAGSAAIARNVWRGLGADGSWSTAFNWSANDAPVEGGDIEFIGTNGLVNVNDTGIKSFRQMLFASNAGSFDIDLNGAGEGMSEVVNNSNSKQLVRGYVNTGNLRKDNGGEVEFVDPVVGGKVIMADSSSPLAIRSTQGNTVTVQMAKSTSDLTGSAALSKFRYLGPGAFLTSRIYPNSASNPISLEDGAIVWITSQNGAKDGLIVAGGVDRIIKAGNCTIGSRFADDMTELLRVVTIEFTDTAIGATVTTDNVDGKPITMQTTCNKSATSRNQGYFKGKGRFNIGGHGTFVFNPQTTFLHTGMTYVGADATAVVKPDVGYTNSAITVAGTLRLEGGIVSKKVSVADGGIVENPGAATLSGGIALTNGAKIRLPVADDGAVTLSQCAITPPSSGLATVELSCASKRIPYNVPITLTRGAKLSAAAADRFTVKASWNGAEFAGNRRVSVTVVDGELTVLFQPAGTVFVVR